MCGLIIAIINLIINESNRRMNAFRLAFDVRNFRNQMESDLEINKKFVISGDNFVILEKDDIVIL